MEDLPDPVGPTRAVFFPTSNFKVILLRTVSFFLDGYEKTTLLKLISPCRLSSFWPVFNRILGYRLIISKLSAIPTLAAAIPLSEFAIWPRLELAVITKKNIPMMFPAVYGFPFTSTLLIIRYAPVPKPTAYKSIYTKLTEPIDTPTYFAVLIILAYALSRAFL